MQWQWRCSRASRTSPSSAAGRSAWRPRGAPPSAGCASWCSTPASPARGTSPPACSRPIAELSPARRRCSSSACAPRPATPPSAPSWRRRPGIDPGLRAEGTLVVARDRDDAEALDRLPRSARGTACTRSGSCRAPRAAPSPRWRRPCGSRSTSRGDHSVDPRRLVAALRRRGARAGGVVRARARVRRDRATCARPASELEDGRVVEAGAVVLAAGAAAGGLGPALPVRPVKGQVLRLRDPQRPRPGRAHDPHARRLPRPARRRPLRARRDDGGARLGHRADRRRRVRAAARHRARSCPACSSSSSRRCSPACGPRRPTTCPRSARARSTGVLVGDGPPPQRHPARRPHRRPGRRRAVRRARCPDGRAAIDPARFAQVPA